MVERDMVERDMVERDMVERDMVERDMVKRDWRVGSWQLSVGSPKPVCSCQSSVGSNCKRPTAYCPLPTAN